MVSLKRLGKQYTLHLNLKISRSTIVFLTLALQALSVMGQKQGEYILVSKNKIQGTHSGTISNVYVQEDKIIGMDVSGNVFQYDPILNKVELIDTSLLLNSHQSSFNSRYFISLSFNYTSSTQQIRMCNLLRKERRIMQSRNYISSIAIDSSNNIFIGFSDPGMVVLADSTLSIIDTIFFTEMPISFIHIWDDSEILFGDYAGSLYRYSIPNKKTIKYYTNSEEDMSSIAWIDKMYDDRIIATGLHNIFILNINGKLKEKYPLLSGTTSAALDRHKKTLFLATGNKEKYINVFDITSKIKPKYSFKVPIESEITGILNCEINGRYFLILTSSLGEILVYQLKK
jgi:hypothetical protein